MSGLNHSRPLFKVMKAGGGERVRTIAEELRTAHRTAAPRAGESPGARCGRCGSRTGVTGELTPRCRGCRAADEHARSAQKSAAAPAARARRGGCCSRCYVEVPASGSCGFCA